ncbi:MAG: hypothetical protein WC046_09375, partial [Candidatus Bathyarchaeia archaeon]
LPEKIKSQKRLIGIIAVILILVFTILFFMRIIQFLTWLLLDVAVWSAANLLIRRISRKSN